MKKKSSAKRKWELAHGKVNFKIAQGKDGVTYVTFMRQGCRLAAPAGTSLAVTVVREDVSDAIDLSVTPPEGKEIIENAVAEVLNDPMSKKELILPRVGKGSQGHEILLNYKRGKVARFKHGTYEIVRESDVAFIDNENAEGISSPARDEDIKLGIKLFRNITGLPREVCRLVIMFILAAYRPYGPYPILVIQGESGTGKSVLTELIRMTIDPVAVLTVACPTTEKDLFAIAQKNHVLAFDNVSGLSNKMYDALCRLSSGGGVAVRKGSKSGMAEYSACRPIILNGIDNIGIRNDFLQRAIIISPPRIEDHKSEQRMSRKYKAALPKILGSLFEAVAHGYHTLKEVKLEGEWRMKGFLEWSIAAGSAFGWSEEAILKDYEENQKAAFQALAESDTLMLLIQELVRREKVWSDTATKLLERIKKIAEEAVIDELVVAKDIPRAPNHLTERLRRSREMLKAYGVDFDNKAIHGARMIYLTWIGDEEVK